MIYLKGGEQRGRINPFQFSYMALTLLFHLFRNLLSIFLKEHLSGTVLIADPVTTDKMDVAPFLKELAA